MNQGIIVDALQSIRQNLTPAQKREVIWIFLLLFVASVLEVFGLAALVPIIISSSDPAFLMKSEILAFVYNALGFQSQTIFLLLLVITVFVFFLVKNLFLSLIFYKQARFSAGIAVNLVDYQFNRFVNLPYFQFQKIGSASITNSTLNIPNSYVNGVVRPILLLLSEMLMIVIVVIAVIAFKPVLFLILLVVLAPATYYTYKALRKKVHHIGSRLNELKPISYKLTNDSFFGYTDIKLAGQHQVFKEKMLANQHEVQHLEAKSFLYNQLPLRIIEMVALLGIVTIFLYSLLIRHNSKELLTIIGLFAAAAYRLMPSINRVLMTLMDLKRNQFAIHDLARQATDIPEFVTPAAYEKEAAIKFNHHIRLNNICFSYPDIKKPILNNINLLIKKGEKIGIIGKSGSGKTTLINILLRFYKEQSGEMLIDDVILPDEAIPAWHSQIGYVKQDVFLMEASVQDNITLAGYPVDHQKLENAIRQASLSEFINQLPNGMKTMVGERGALLSGGQRQRIGIARALYRNCNLLILDEATSALDSETEAVVSESIHNLSKTEITVIIISHRLSILQNCDRVLALENGSLTETAL